MKKLLQPFLNVRTLIYLIGTLVTVYFPVFPAAEEKNRAWMGLPS